MWDQRLPRWRRGLGLVVERPLGVEGFHGKSRKREGGSWSLNLSKEGLDPFSEMSRGRISVPRDRKDPNSPFSSQELGVNGCPRVRVSLARVCLILEMFMAKKMLTKSQKLHPKPDLKEIKADRKILIGEKGEEGRISSPWAFLYVWG